MNSACRKQEKPEIVFIGDSIIEFWVYTHPHFFSKNNYVGKGVSGQTTSQILDRFQKDVIALNPPIVLIEGGINDIAGNGGAYDPDKTFENIKTMADAADKHGIKVILTLLLPVDTIPWNPHLSEVSKKVSEMNSNLEAYAKEKGFVYLDYYSPLKDSNGGIVPQFTTDGVHLSKEGYDIIEAVTNEAIMKISAK